MISGVLIKTFESLVAHQVGERIVKIKKELEEVKRTRGLHRKARKRVPYPVVALVGYTNAGKSSLLNALTDAGVLVENALFATLDPTVRRARTPHGRGTKRTARSFRSSNTNGGIDNGVAFKKRKKIQVPSEPVHWSMSVKKALSFHRSCPPRRRPAASLSL